MIPPLQKVNSSSRSPAMPTRLCPGKCLHDGETDFVDSVGEVIDFVGVEVVEDYSESTGCDTEGG